MDEFTYTPKPWRYVGTRSPIQSPQGNRIEMHVVATNHPNGEWESIYCKTEEDAKLIAVAPDMLESLHELVAGLYAVGITMPKIRNATKDALDRAKAIIEKAEGV
jgi:hypothetical protein